MMVSSVVIVGASHGGVQAAHSLRQKGFAGRIILISDDPDLPYHRPPLSKSFLVEEKAPAALLKPEAFYKENAIELRLDSRVTSIDALQKTLDLSGERLTYDHLILATGATARRITDTPLENVHYLRDLGDAKRLRRQLPKAKSIAIVGGGFIGLEVAATARKLNKTVTIIEAQAQLLKRTMPLLLANHIAARHIAQGSRIHFDASVEAIENSSGLATAIILECGRRIEADLILVGVGSVANVELAKQAGLIVQLGGISVDRHLRSSDPSIFAIGDCATFPDRFSNNLVRLESVQNASDQARCVANTITGDEEEYEAVPWFWTDQFDMKIQMAGLPQEETWDIIRGEPSTGSFSLLQFSGNKLVSSYSINAPADHIVSRKLIKQGQPLDVERACNPEIRLNNCTIEPQLDGTAA